MTVAIRRLGPGDEAVLRVLADDEDAFDLADRSPEPAVSGEDAAAYLADPAVLHWVAEEDGVVVGHVLCYVERRRAGPARQLLLYEIGVREAHRRRGVGRALVGAMREWMAAERVAGAWVVSAPDAEGFYVACGFVREAEQGIQLTLEA